MTDLPFADLVQSHLHWNQPVTIAELALELQRPRRQIEAGVEELRRRGVPIVTGSDGVWLTTSADELLDSYRRLRSRALHQLANLRAMQRTARAMRGFVQETLWKDAA